MADSRKPSASAPSRWLAIIGIGEDGLNGLGTAAKQAIAEAELVFGGARHLELAAPLIAGEARVWPSPFAAAMEEIAGLRGRSVCVLASGDPFHYGVGATLARHVDPAEWRVFPAPSAFSLAAAKLGWPLQDIETVSLHGRPIEAILPLLHPGRRVIALTSDGAAPAQIAALISEAGFGPSVFHVMERLGGPSERYSSFAAEGVGGKTFDPLNVIAIEVRAGPSPRVLPLASGLEDALFEHDGQITKREVRALTLSALAPRRGQSLWDLGAGSGSVAISWMLAHPSLQAIAVEADPQRAVRISRNASRLGVPALRVVEGRVPQALAGLPAPDAIFIGGGGSDPGVLDHASSSLKPGGRLVANAVTLEMEALLLTQHARLGGELTWITLSRAAPLGGMTGWQPARPVLQWRWTKP